MCPLLLWWNGMSPRKGRPDYAASLAREANSTEQEKSDESDHRALSGIIRQSALWRLCRCRHNRHTFAVHRLTSWYRQGADVQRLLPQLSVYLGHVYLSSTQV